MLKSRAILLTLAAIAGTGWIQPATAGLTAEDEAAVPPDIFVAYKNARNTRPYICHGEAFGKADTQMEKLKEKIRLRYRADFDVPRDDDPIFIPTVCPSPDDYPDYSERVRANLDAVQRLARVLDRHPSPVNEKLAREDAAIRGLLLQRVKMERGEPICFNRTLLGVNARKLAELKREATSLERYFPRQPPFFAKGRDLAARAFKATALTWGELKIRVATADECSHHLTYALHRPLLDEDFALLFGTQLRGVGAYQFVTVGFPSYEGWTTNPYHLYAGEMTSAPVDPAAIRAAEAEHRFYILEPGLRAQPDSMLQ